jgi:hypothetical protein
MLTPKVAIARFLTPCTLAFGFVPLLLFVAPEGLPFALAAGNCSAIGNCPVADKTSNGANCGGITYTSSTITGSAGVCEINVTVNFTVGTTPCNVCWDEFCETAVCNTCVGSVNVGTGPHSLQRSHGCGTCPLDQPILGLKGNQGSCGGCATYFGAGSGVCD